MLRVSIALMTQRGGEKFPLNDSEILPPALRASPKIPKRVI